MDDPGRRAAARDIRNARDIGYHLAQMRKQRGKTQAEVARAMGVSQARVSRMEHGDIERMQNVSPAPDQRDQARRVAADLARALARTDFVLPGSVTRRMTRCGHPSCHCHADPPLRHSPCNQWTRKVAGKTVTRLLTAGQLASYQPWPDSQRRLRSLVTELETLSLAIFDAYPRWKR